LNDTNTRPLLDWLLLQYPDTPKTRARQWVLAGRVSIDGEVIRKPHHLLPDPGASLKLLERQAGRFSNETGWKIHPKVTLLYLDSALAVLNKDAGLISVPAQNCKVSALGVLAEFLVADPKRRDRRFVGPKLPTQFRKLHPLPVHRLDQYTSGVFCVALNPASRNSLIDQLKTHKMGRQYIAYVQGRSATTQGTWSNWLQLSEDGLHQEVVAEQGPKPGPAERKEAITHFEVFAEYRLERAETYITKLRLRLETGLKHQIRVQAANAGLPLIGDRTYNPAYAKKNVVRPPIPFSRQALHAEVLSLEHPDQPGKIMSWKAQLPADLQQLETNLRSMAAF
jgi:23S rRNA pseudouridine1911/1915/1917 synthase